MMNLNLILSVILIACSMALPSVAEQLSDRRDLQETIAFESPGSRRLVIDNVWGSIVVEGYDGPFRCPDRESEGNCWNRWHDRYEVIHDFRIRVPHAADLEVRTVNHGDIEVSGVHGDFLVHNVKVDVSFQPDLSADLEMVARWGELWSEYRVEPLPSLPPTKHTQGGRTVIEVQSGSRVRVASGGPTHSFATLNGNIYVRKGTTERGDDDA